MITKGGMNKSKGERKARGGVNMRQATSNLPIPQTVSRQRQSGGQRKMAAPVATSIQQRLRKPLIVRTPKGQRIAHRELVASINGSVAFSALKFAVNPGIAATFPWLAPQAVQWEQYCFKKCNFEYVTRTGTTTVGSVILAPDYDASDLTPTTEQQITAYEDAVEDVAWKDITCILQKDSMHPLGPRKFIRSVATGGDIKTYDVANFFLAVLEEAGSAAIGKLWVDYDVEFFVPQNSPSAALGPDGTSFYIKTADQAFTTTVAAANTYETSVFDPLGIGAPVAGVYTPPAGTYFIQANQDFSDTSAENFQAIMEFQKNSANLTNRARSNFNFTSPANGVEQLSVNAVITFNGTDTFQVQCTLTGAAGTLKGNGLAGQLIFSLA